MPSLPKKLASWRPSTASKRRARRKHGSDFPASWNDPLVRGGAQREIETLGILQRDLPDSYIVYHGVHWTQLNKGFSIFGEADFVVVSPPAACL